MPDASRSHPETTLAVDRQRWNAETINPVRLQRADRGTDEPRIFSS